MHFEENLYGNASLGGKITFEIGRQLIRGKNCANPISSSEIKVGFEVYGILSINLFSSK